LLLQAPSSCKPIIVASGARSWLSLVPEPSSVGLSDVDVNVKVLSFGDPNHNEAPASTLKNLLF
jgi:hypothetical protein